MSDYRLTYSTMFQPPEALHVAFEQSLENVRARLGGQHALHIGGRDVHTPERFEKRSPINTDWYLGSFAKAGAAQADEAMRAAHGAFDGWRRTHWKHRAALLHRIAALVEERVTDISAAVTIEVGKTRLEALGEVQEVVDFFRFYADEMERNGGYLRVLPDDPVEGYRCHNRSVLKPYGARAVVSPYNFPFALSGGPVAAALVTGNTVVLKASSETPWSVRLLADCVRDAGLPPGVFNFLSGPGSLVGQALLEHPRLAGITFTGSYETGMHIWRGLAAGRYPRPAVLEMGGKNAAVVTRDADLDRAALGIVRSAFGLSGQKCSALSRVYVEQAVADDLIGRVLAATAALRIGDPTQRAIQLGPVAHARAAEGFARYTHRLARETSLLAGGGRLRGEAFDRGYYCAPTVAEAPVDHPLFAQEMFVPVLMIARVPDRESALAAANDVDLGLTAGMYGSQDDIAWFLDGIEAGVTYCNRPQGATTGAWPGYQPFGGWKGSSSTGKGIASAYYLPLYLREQSQTVVE